MKLLLRPLSLTYRGIMSVRNWMYDQRMLAQVTSSVPVICIGNLSAGGNFKTPLTIAMCRLLQSMGRRPAVLSRGYGGSLRGPHLVADSDIPAAVGDEPLLIHREVRCPVVIARKRVEGAKLIEQKQLADVIVLDDGFQHRALARDVNLIAVNASTPEACTEFIQGRVLPEGLYREAREEGFRRADAVILTLIEGLPAPDNLERLVRSIPRSLPHLRARLMLGPVRSLSGEETIEGGSVVAVSGIANPERFVRSLASRGFVLAEQVLFADHHRFTREQIAAIQKKHPGLPIVCTLKDAVKIAAFKMPGIFVQQSIIEFDDPTQVEAIVREKAGI